MGPLELAVLAVLLLRGVQTVGEVRSQVQRLVPLTGPGEVDAVLDTLAARTPRPFAARVRGRGHEGPPRWVEVLTAPAPDGGDARAGDPPGNGGPARAGAAPRPVPAELASAPYADLAARVSELEQRLDASLERAPAAGDWPTPAFPPPPPPVGLGPVGAPGLPAGDRSEGAPGRGDLAQLADRLRDIERRLARIEAELGALR